MKLSVSLVSYQEEAYIAETMDSILAQETNFDFEIIVGDDASTDDTRAILKRYSDNYPDKVRLLLPEKNYGDFGLSNFMSTLELCKGEYIAFLDGDDYWTDKSKLQRQVDFLDSNPNCSFSAHRIEHLRDDGHSELSPLPSRSFNKLQRKNNQTDFKIYSADTLIRRNFAHKISTVARASAVQQIPEWYRTTKIASADWVFNLLLSKSGDIGFIDTLMATHRKRSGNLSDTYGQRRLLEDRIKTLHIMRAEIPGHRSAYFHAWLKTKIKISISMISPRIYHWAQRVYSSHHSKTDSI